MILSQIIEELVEERDLDRNALSNIVCEGMLAAYEKKYPELQLEAVYNKTADKIDVLVWKEVVGTVVDELSQISIRKARSVKADTEVGEKIRVPFDGVIGRIEILRAKQFISQRVRQLEAAQVYEEFKPKEGSIMSGVVHKCEMGGAVVKIQDAFAFLPKSLMIPAERCVAGYALRALVKEVLAEPRNENQIVLDRVSEAFLRQLFELEIPEVFDRIVEVKKIVRIAGYKSKVVVASNDKNIDPVGTCVGVGGARIKPILRELAGEKIDILVYTDDLERLVRDSLKPAEVERVEISGDIARVWVDEDQRSVAIGKGGKNIALASRLTGLDIELVKGLEESGESLADMFTAAESADEKTRDLGDFSTFEDFVDEEK
ncbi:TPA: transcription termination factor NusA [Candidatus Dependentiae bacterium]|nr:transcription termination factor NusA [Candidatus Dependentiae bacterium]